MSGVLVVDAEVDGRTGVAVRVLDGLITEVGTGLAPRAGETVHSAAGRTVIPGLHDHHVHLRSAAAAAASAVADARALAAAGSSTAALRTVARADPGSGWLRVVGLPATVAQTLDRQALDAAVADRPLRVQDHTGTLWLLNSTAVQRLGVAEWPDAGVERDARGEPIGRLWRLDARLRAATAAADDAHHVDGLRRLSRVALALGITRFTDATPGRTAADIDAFGEYARTSVVRQRLVLMADPELAPPDTGEPARVTLGPHKIVLDDDRLPAAGHLAADIRRVHRLRGNVAVHCVTAAQLVVALAAFELAGARPGDRLEHAGIVPPGWGAELAGLGLTVVTQPAFVAHRGDDYLREVDEYEREWLYPCRSLLAAGVPVAAGSDAPFGPLDPWLGIRTAVSRRTAQGATVAPDEGVDASGALALYLGRAQRPGSRRRIAVGEPGDLCILTGPCGDVIADPTRTPVAAVLLDDEVVPVGGAS